GNIRTWNHGAERLKGYTAAEIIGKNFACFFSADDRAAGRPQHNLEEARKHGHLRDVGIRVRKDGSPFHAEVLLTQIRDESGKEIGFSKVTRDITDQIRARSAEAARLAAEKASKAKDEFLAALSHELRTPLTPVLAAAGYLAENAAKLPEGFNQELDTIQRNVKLQARLIDDLLDLTRVTRGKIELHFDRLDAHELIREAIDVARAEIEKKGLRVSTALKARKHLVWGDRIRLVQVLWNLINNAVKFSPAGGEIEIQTGNDNHNHFQFILTDHGIGIEPDRLDALFMPFEQGDASITRTFGGLGLGLAISKHLVDLHDGSIKAESRGRNHGATFSVSLDVLEEQVGTSGVSARNPGKPPKSLRILLVEDHGDTRRTLCRLLKHFGHNISEADSTQRALEIIRSQAFDVVLSDIGLPDGTGYEVISRAKQQQHLKGVALTGFGSDEDIRRGREAGFDFHLTKPVDFHELRSILDNVSS
ncbi:MAG TPA: ATP-binding protein, partial [Chthoniobacterales bacterium]|nr:ATP-binding protein [Chthoniobacterales bacterium]